MKEKNSGASHWSLSLYLDHLSSVSVPDSSFNPRGAWDHRYDVFPVYGRLDMTGNAWSQRHKGAFQIKHEPAEGGGTVRLEVFSEVTFLDFETLPTKYQRTSVIITCCDDQLATPMHWQLKSMAIGRDDLPRPNSEITETGVVKGNRFERRLHARNRSSLVGEPVTSNWSLFDAVQRLPEDAYLEFIMLENLCLVRREQRIVPETPIKVEFTNRTVRLQGFRQTGEGVLPTHWWRDEYGRVLLMLGNARAYIWHG